VTPQRGIAQMMTDSKGPSTSLRGRAYPPSQWFLPGPEHMRGAQRGVSLATGIFTGESRQRPLCGSHFIKLQCINNLQNHDRSALDSFADIHAGIHPAEARALGHVASLLETARGCGNRPIIRVQNLPDARESYLP